MFQGSYREPCLGLLANTHPLFCVSFVGEAGGGGMLLCLPLGGCCFSLLPLLYLFLGRFGLCPLHVAGLVGRLVMDVPRVRKKRFVFREQVATIKTWVDEG